MNQSNNEGHTVQDGGATKHSTIPYSERKISLSFKFLSETQMNVQAILLWMHAANRGGMGCGALVFFCAQVFPFSINLNF